VYAPLLHLPANQISAFILLENLFVSSTLRHFSYRNYQRWAWTGSGLDILQDTCDFFGSGFGYSFLKKIRSGQDQDIGLISIMKFSFGWFKMSQMMVAVFSLLLLVFILSVYAVLITINCNSGFIVNFVRPSWSSKLLLFCWYAALFVVLNGICVWLCRLI